MRIELERARSSGDRSIDRGQRRRRRWRGRARAASACRRRAAADWLPPRSGVRRLQHGVCGSPRAALVTHEQQHSPGTRPPPAGRSRPRGRRPRLQRCEGDGPPGRRHRRRRVRPRPRRGGAGPGRFERRPFRPPRRATESADTSASSCTGTPGGTSLVAGCGFSNARLPGVRRATRASSPPRAHRRRTVCTARHRASVIRQHNAWNRASGHRRRQEMRGFGRICSTRPPKCDRRGAPACAGRGGCGFLGPV